MWRILLSYLLVSGCVDVPVVIAQLGPFSDPPIVLQNQGVDQGKVQTLDFSGSGVTCVRNSLTGVGRCAIAGGGSNVGTIIEGTSCVQNPIVVSTLTTQAHGLGVKPTFVLWYIENIIAQHGYAVGDRIYTFQDSATARGSVVSADATNVYIASGSALYSIVNRTTRAFTTITAANWRFVAVPYKIN